MEKAILNVNGHKKTSTDITYEDLIYLYKQYIDRTGCIPTLRDATQANNLPQPNIIKRILCYKNISYVSFMMTFGKYSHVRADANVDYNDALNGFLSYAKRLNRTPTKKDLVCNHDGLPNSAWYVQHCPNDDVDTYDKFVRWCGLQSNIVRLSKQQVIESLRSYESKVGRPIKHSDITADKIGFSNAVVNRLFGSISVARREANLALCETRKTSNDTDYVECLRKVLEDYKCKSNSNYITWKAIESGVYGTKTYDHKTYERHFRNAEIDISQYIKSFGLLMNPSGFSSTYTFESGEKTKSSLEHSFTCFLNEIGFRYNVDYWRDVKYRDFVSNVTSKIDCDYVIKRDGDYVFIEIAGMIDRPQDGNWRLCDYNGDLFKQKYRDNLIKKENVLRDFRASYFFLFRNDISDGSFVDRINDIILCKAI